MAEEDYELMPRQEISELRQELRKLKGNASPGVNLHISMEKLSANIEEMLLLIRDASKGVKEEEGPMMLAIQEGLKDIKELKEQNKRIAEALLAVADMIKKPVPEKKPAASPFDNPAKFGEPMDEPQGFGPMHGGPLPQPNFSAPPQGGPMPPLGPMPPPAQIPRDLMPFQGIPPPPGPMPLPKKRGLFGR